MSLWGGRKSSSNPFSQFYGGEVYPNISTFDQEEKNRQKQYDKEKARIRLSHKLQKELFEEELKWRLFHHEQKGEIEKIAIQKKKDQYIQQRQQHECDEQHKRLLGQQSFKEYTSKMGHLKRNNGMRGMSKDENEKLIDVEEEEQKVGDTNDMYDFRDRWTSGWV